MTKQILIAFFLLLTVLSVSAQTTDKTVERIQKFYTETAEKARLAETDDDQGQYGPLFVNELTVNSRNHQWRAVGIHRLTYKFFYKGGDSKTRMYPDQLVLVKTERKESIRTYTEQFLFSDAGVLMFYSQKVENDDQSPADRSIYFSGAAAIRVIEDGQTRDRFSAAELKNIGDIKRTASKIKDLFVKSINL